MNGPAAPLLSPPADPRHPVADSAPLANPCRSAHHSVHHSAPHWLHLFWAEGVVARHLGNSEHLQVLYGPPSHFASDLDFQIEGQFPVFRDVTKLVKRLLALHAKTTRDGSSVHILDADTFALCETLIRKYLLTALLKFLGMGKHLNLSSFQGTTRILVNQKEISFQGLPLAMPQQLCSRQQQPPSSKANSGTSGNLHQLMTRNARNNRGRQSRPGYFANLDFLAARPDSFASQRGFCVLRLVCPPAQSDFVSRHFPVARPDPFPLHSDFFCSQPAHPNFSVARSEFFSAPPVISVLPDFVEQPNFPDAFCFPRSSHPLDNSSFCFARHRSNLGAPEIGQATQANQISLGTNQFRESNWANQISSKTKQTREILEL